MSFSPCFLIPLGCFIEIIFYINNLPPEYKKGRKKGLKGLKGQGQYNYLDLNPLSPFFLMGRRRSHILDE
jgi:hypothetical protein